MTHVAYIVPQLNTFGASQLENVLEGNNASNLFNNFSCWPSTILADTALAVLFCSCYFLLPAAVTLICPPPPPFVNAHLFQNNVYLHITNNCTFKPSFQI